MKDSPEPGEIHTGVLQSASNRGGFVVLEAPGLQDVFVPESAGGGALHGDQVRIRIVSFGGDRSPEGRIERILRHANTRIVGQLRRSGKHCIVTPKNSKIRRLVEIHRRFTNEEVPQDAWVIVEITRWSSSPDEPLPGKLVEVLGTEDDRRLPILLLVREGGIQPEFPPEVEKEIRGIRERGITPHEASRRRDFRSGRVMTIDPATAKDFDDAISLIERTPRGWRIGVHIADVAYYVHPGSLTDLEAYDRATSIYPVDRVIPMLPEALSNELCSLRPGEEKLTMSALFTVTKDGEVRDAELCESIILSVRRFSYEEAQGLMDEADGIVESSYPRPNVAPEIAEDLLEIRKASAALLRARMRRGALDLDLPETEILFDGAGLVSEVRRKSRFEAHRLIEELMLSANEAVARELERHHVPFLYRVHEAPAEEKLRALGPVLGRFGIQVPAKGTMDQSQLQTAILKAQEHPAGVIVQRLVLRAMMRAKYQPGNVGHFGLASPCYTHFTSPIRRYPDLITHRALKALLGSEKAREKYSEQTAGLLPEWGRHTSGREERSQKIERDAEKILTCEYMKRFLGDIFEGYISGVLGRGFFVELIELPAEGFIPIKSLEDDYYDFDDQNLAFIGRKSGRIYGLGDKVKIQIERIDVMASEMDFKLVRREAKAGRKEKPGKEKKGRTGTPGWRNNKKGRGKRSR